ncbi:MAG: protease modulator HflC, partial [Clostridiales bacterium]|nr:protease modulator HflC [Clostridiales bacterium]
MKVVHFFANICKIILIAAILLGLGFTFFSVTVPSGYAAYVKRFGRAENIHTAPGLYFKLPMDEVSYIPTNKQLYNLNPSDVITLDKKTMNVSSFVIWQVTDPRSVMENLGAESNINPRINSIVYNALKNTLSSMNQEEIITLRGGSLSDAILNMSRERMSEFGVAISDVKINKFDLPSDNKEAVYRRMISERDSIAAMYLAEGDEEAKKIRNEIKPETDILISTARADADKLRAEGEAEYMRILAEAYNGADR